MADGRRERGARIELTLRIAPDREFDEGDEEGEESEDGRDRGEVAVAVELRSTGLTARSGVRTVGDSTAVIAGDSEIGETTKVSPRCSRASSIK
jgi:hypothetical protein